MDRRDRFTLPSDLQNFGDHFSNHEFPTSMGLNNQQQQEQQQPVAQSFAGQGKNFSDFQMLQDNANHINRAVNESHNNPDDSMTGKPNNGYTLHTFENFGTQSQHSPDVGINKTQVLHQLLSDQPQLKQTTYPVSSPEYPKGSPVSSSGSPYTDSNMSPFQDVTSNYMDMEESHHSHLQDLNHSVKFPDTSTQSTLIKGTDRLRLDSFNTESCLAEEFKPKLEWSDPDLENKVGKVARMQQDSDASSALSPSVDRVFNPEDAQQEVPKEFTFTVFGTQAPKTDESHVELLPFGDVAPR